MNHPNLPEEQMRRWTPRPPSASRRAEIFSRTAVGADDDLLSPTTARFLRGVFAPVLACAMFSLAVFNHGGNAQPGGQIVWNGSNFIADASHTAQNRWESVTFDWTNGGVFRSSIPFASATNFSH
jgi:hypothetical protein